MKCSICIFISSQTGYNRHEMLENGHVTMYVYAYKYIWLHEERCESVGFVHFICFLFSRCDLNIVDCLFHILYLHSLCYCASLIHIPLASWRFIILLHWAFWQMVKVGEQEELSKLKIAECKLNLKRIREEKVWAYFHVSS